MNFIGRRNRPDDFQRAPAGAYRLLEMSGIVVNVGNALLKISYTANIRWIDNAQIHIALHPRRGLIGPSYHILLAILVVGDGHVIVCNYHCGPQTSLVPGIDS